MVLCVSVECMVRATWYNYFNHYEDNNDDDDDDSAQHHSLSCVAETEPRLSSIASRVLASQATPTGPVESCGARGTAPRTLTHIRPRAACRRHPAYDETTKFASSGLKDTH